MSLRILTGSNLNTNYKRFSLNFVYVPKSFGERTEWESKIYR